MDPTRRCARWMEFGALVADRYTAALSPIHGVDALAVVGLRRDQIPVNVHRVALGAVRVRGDRELTFPA